MSGMLLAAGCRNHMPHSFTWFSTGNQSPSHPKPPEGGYYKNWDPYAATIEVTPVEDVNPVGTQHIFVATVKDKNGKPLPNRRVEWMISDGVGSIVEVDESGLRDSRGYKMDNRFAVSHTNNFKHVLTRGNDDPSRVLPHVTPAEVAAQVREAIDIAAPGGGYILASDHSLHDGIPVENILAMFRTGAEYGREVYRHA